MEITPRKFVKKGNGNIEVTYDIDDGNKTQTGLTLEVPSDDPAMVAAWLVNKHPEDVEITTGPLAGMVGKPVDPKKKDYS